MRIALLEACNPKREGRVFMPMGLAYVGAYLEQQEPGVQVVIAESLEEALAAEPDLVGISSMTPSFGFARSMAETLRAHRDIPVILGGPHITGLPSSLPDAFLAGVLGEGEETFVELVRACRTRAQGPSDLAAIPGIVFHDGSQHVVNRPRSFIRPLDRIPYPKRDWAGIKGQSLWSFSSRGCPYRCRFCSTAEFWESYRVHSARYVIDELNLLIEQFDTTFHTFMDDLFAVNVKRLEEIVALAKSELRRRLTLTVTIRADLVTERMCRLLREIGVGYCHLGLESGSDRVLTYLKKETTTAARNQAALEMLNAFDIRCIGSFIIGAPLEEEEDLQQTYDFIANNIRSARLMSFTFGPLVAFPGTAVWEDCKKRGLVDEQTVDWEALDIDLRFFDVDRYTLLSNLSRERFKYWFDRFNALWEESKGSLVQRLGHYNRQAGEVITGQIA